MDQSQTNYAEWNKPGKKRRQKKIQTSKLNKKLDNIKTKTFNAANHTIKKVKRQPTWYKKVFENHIW